MKNFDLIKIRKSLPHGAITEIAEKIGVDPRTVSEVLNEGWHKQHTNEVVSLAIEILKRSNIDPAVIKEATAMNFTTESPFAFGHKRFGKKKRAAVVKSGVTKMFGKDSTPILIVAGLFVAFLLFKPKTTTA